MTFLMFLGCCGFAGVTGLMVAVGNWLREKENG